ncbi:MAG: cytochrome c biogenesis protein CcsA [Proteobacteria bacterium]|nr:cytochrome c biogenesis protein CcsA [Pseudomonadota bacterium]
MPDIVLHLAVSALYGGLALHFWRTRWRPRETPHAGMAAWERAALLVPMALQGWLLHQDLIAPEQLRFGFGQALSVMLWLGVTIYWVESLFYNLDGMQPLVLPLAAVAAPLPALFPGMAVTHAASIEFRLHLILGMAAYSVFTIAMLHALLMALAERSLHKMRKAPLGDGPGGPLGGPLAGLPPLLTLERLLFRLIGLAFVLLTLTLATGLVFSESLFGRALRFDHKTLFALFSWLTFAILLLGRYAYGWRGRMALRFTLLGFVMLLLAYVGSRFVLEVVLGRV